MGVGYQERIGGVVRLCGPENLGNGHDFFFSSRRRHTRFDCDWSSDVCSSDLALPPDTPPDFSDGAKGSWRAHLNAVKTVVKQNLSTALIVEDDIDWDIHIKSQIGRASCRERV